MKKHSVLLAGKWDESVLDIVSVLEGECGVTVVSREKLDSKLFSKTKYYSLDLDYRTISSLNKANHFDAIIYNFCSFCDGGDINDDCLGALLDELHDYEKLAVQSPNIKSFFLITDQRSFSDTQSREEGSTPSPATNDGRLVQLAENEFFKIRRSDNELRKVLIRTTNLYSKSRIFSALSHFRRRDAGESSAAFLGMNKDMKYDFLSADDFGEFILSALSTDIGGTYHLSSANPVSGTDIEKMLSELGCEVDYSIDNERVSNITGMKAYDDYGWIARRSFLEDAEEYGIEKEKISEEKQLILEIRNFLGRNIAWVETVLGAAVMQLMLGVVNQNTVFSVIDVRLLFVVLIGSMHGSFFGWLAGIIAYVSFGISFVATGGNAWDLLLNMDNWIPLVLYLLAGGITGYVRSNHDNREQMLTDLNLRTREDLENLQEIHQQTCDMRDSLMEQVVNSHDSYGKIYGVVEQLDTMYPDEILFHALNIYEDILSNKSITIYYREKKASFIRKLVESNEVEESGGFSLDIRKFPDLLESVETNSLYTNKEFLKGYPSYCISMEASSSYQFIMMIWNAKPSQYSKYYQNLIIVLSRLIRISLTKALEFQLSPDRYIGNTSFLKQDEFLQIWLTRRKMKLNNVGEYIIFRFSSALPDDVLSNRFKTILRALDSAGKMNDGRRYVLIMQATEASAEPILRRLESAGVAASLVSEKELESYLS